MTLEQAALAALGSVTAGLCVLAKILLARSEACERWRNEMQPIIQGMAERLGFASGTAQMVNNCPVKGCPYAGNIDGTFSMQKPKTKQEKPEQ